MTKAELKTVRIDDWLVEGTKHFIKVYQHLGDRIVYKENGYTHEVNYEYLHKPTIRELLMFREEILSRVSYLTDKKAIKLWDFLKKYVQETKDSEGDIHLMIPAFRVLDALSMINQDKIEYSGL
jgi:hypothetical protein